MVIFFCCFGRLGLLCFVQFGTYIGLVGFGLVGLIVRFGLVFSYRGCLFGTSSLDIVLNLVDKRSFEIAL